MWRASCRKWRCRPLARATRSRRNKWRSCGPGLTRGSRGEPPRPATTSRFPFLPTFGGTTVSGDTRKFRERYWQPGGIERRPRGIFVLGKIAARAQASITGHALLNDYKVKLEGDKTDLGFVRGGWEQYRKYYDDTGGFFSGLSGGAPMLGDDIHLDIGKAWIDLGLTLPNWPRMVLGYEYDYGAARRPRRIGGFTEREPPRATSGRTRSKCAKGRISSNLISTPKSKA